MASEETTANVSGPGEDGAELGLYDTFVALSEGNWEPALGLLTDIAVPALLALLGLGVSYLVAKFLARLISAPICRKVDETLGRFAGKFVFNGLMICAVIGVASTVGLNVTSFAAVLAAAGFAIGMAFQGTLGNFAAGILLLVFRPFRVGDVINAAGVIGKVNEIDLFTITLDTPDNRRIIVPNSAVSAGTIENVTFHAHRRTEVAVGVCYTADVDATRAALTAAAESLPDLIVNGEGRGYAVVLSDLGASSVNWLVRFWTPTSKVFEAKERLTQAVKAELDAAGISIPYPQLDVHLKGQLDRQLAGFTAGSQADFAGPPEVDSATMNPAAINPAVAAAAFNEAAARVRPRLRNRAS
ncbi:mechanosensitive ion channel family protein [Planctomycetaceae bacterium SH139]